jgi:hypothetical protein
MQNNILAIPEQMVDQDHGSLSGLAKWETKKELALVTRQAMVTIAKEQGRALLTQMALESVGALTSLEEHLTKIAPAGADRYRYIVDAYSMGVAQRIARW